MNKRLIYDLAHLMRRPIVLCSNDSKSCYDRIAQFMASMSLQRMGMPIQPLKSMFSTIQSMEHAVRTAFGDSLSSIHGRNEELPYQGILQDNGGGPITWGATSTPAVTFSRQRKRGLEFKTPMSNERSKLVRFIVVDDTDLCEGKLHNPKISIHEVLDEAQTSIECWE